MQLLWLPKFHLKISDNTIQLFKNRFLNILKCDKNIYQARFESGVDYFGFQFLEVLVYQKIRLTKIQSQGEFI